jgi:hypothetical protein
MINSPPRWFANATMSFDISLAIVIGGVTLALEVEILVLRGSGINKCLEVLLGYGSKVNADKHPKP